MKRFFFLSQDPCEEPSGRADDVGRTAEGRSELAELADDSAFSADATIPPSPRGARSMTGR